MQSTKKIVCRINARFLIALLFIGVLLSQFGCQKNPAAFEEPASYEWPVSAPEAQGMDSAVLSEAVDAAEDLRFVIGLLVVKNGYLVMEEYLDDAYGKEDAYDICSVTKTVVSVLVGIAVHRGFIPDLDQSMLDFFPEYVHDGLDPRKHEITIRHLLTLQAGFDKDNKYPEPDPEEDYLRQVIDLPLATSPGETFCYSSHSVSLLMAIIGRTSGMHPLSFAQKYLCEPLGITLGEWAKDAQGIPYGGYGLMLTPRNMARMPGNLPFFDSPLCDKELHFLRKQPSAVFSEIGERCLVEPVVQAANAIRLSAR